MIYGFIEISDVEVIDKTCSKMDIPPKPRRKAQIVIFIDILLIGILDIIDTPLVSSTIPDKVPFINSVGIWRIENIGDTNVPNILRIFELFNIDIMTLKSITKPPIITTVLTDDIILLCKILPKLLIEGGVFLFTW